MKNSNLELVMENFDWEKVHKVMTFLNWRWCRYPEPDGVPEIDEMKELVIALVKDAQSELDQYNPSSSGSGGFSVTINRGNSGYLYHSISFELEKSGYL